MTERKDRDDGAVGFLTSTSHRAEELELYQLQIDQGPCLESVHTDRHVFATRLDDVRARCPALEELFRRAGFVGVHAAPPHWHGHAISPAAAAGLTPRQPWRAVVAMPSRKYRCASAKTTIIGTVAITLAAMAISQWYSPDIAKASTICFSPRGIVK